MIRTIAAVTVARSDYGIYRPILREIVGRAGLRLHLIVSGTHLLPEFGSTVSAIEADGFSIGDRVEMLLGSDSPEAIAKSMGLGAIGFAQAYARVRPDLLLIVGDRFEMHAAVVAALPFRIPVAHVHGGELSFGSIDDAFRHSMTKLSHLHFVSTAAYARRVEQLGEEPWRITVSGAPGLDTLRTIQPLPAAEFSRRFGITPMEDFLLVTYHPATFGQESVAGQFRELAAALEESGRPVLFTMPNADTGGRELRVLIHAYVAAHPSAQAVENLGSEGYATALGLAAAMVGNSSSGIVEAASFALPVVNVGNRQDGRVRGANVIDCAARRDAISAALTRALDPAFRAGLAGVPNPYGDGSAAVCIVDRLAAENLGEALLLKRFHDLEGTR
jgi:UDP-hydrolysing UDP-N-acetyl-D-glucosamine 2-epimerase